MLVTFGKYAGKSTELLVLKHPDYVVWLRYQSSLKGLALAARNDCVRLIAKFDSASYTRPCSKCRQPATRTTFYAGNATDCYTWCDACDPYSSGALQGKLTVVDAYKGALLQAALYHGNRVTAQRDAVQALGRAKGLGKSVTEKQAIAFFAR